MEYGTIAKLMAGRQFYFIAYNVKRLCAGGEIEAEMFNPQLNLN